MHLVASLAGVRPGEVVVVEGDEAHHAVAVRRLRVGERVLLTDGVGAAVRGEVTATGKRVFEVRADEVDPGRAAPTPELVVVQALPKGDRGERAVEVLTEVGVALVVPWAAQRCVTSWKGERGAKAVARWRSTAREAGKQSRRVWHPEVADLAGTADVLALVRSADLAVVLHEEASVALAGLEVPATGRVLVVVGPEGGITPEELDALTAAGAHVVRLGAEVLRTSTAGVVACAALLARTPRWR